ncbi:MAG: hypothetical protein QOF97_368 [Acidimicrobiaceae bacterium]
MGLVAAVVLVVVAVMLLLAWASDRRDRAGRHERRPARTISATGRAIRREGRWRRAQLDREIIPPDKLDDGRRRP